MKVGGAEYAKVATRLKQFREDCPRGSIETKPVIENETLIFTTTIIKDLADSTSARATGTALTRLKGGIKEFEKTESISVGRALALLGYLASGEIASAEEMLDFEQHRVEKHERTVSEINTVDELKNYYNENKGIGSWFDQLVTARKKELNENS